MADKIFGTGLDPVPLKYVGAPPVVPAYNAEPRPVYISGLPTGGDIEDLQAIVIAQGETITALQATVQAQNVRITALESA